MPLKEVIKRDGVRVPFDGGRIASAIARAQQAVGQADGELAAELATVVEHHLERTHDRDEIPLEAVQDAVIYVLQESGNYDAATAYTRYRDARERARRQRRLAGDEPAAGSLDGKPFASIEDADPRIGPRLEIFAAGAYLWLPFKHIASVEMQPPKRLRDLIWIPAIVRPGPSFQGAELGEVLLPALCVFSSRHPKDDVRLGRMTEWEEQDGVTVPAGQKMLLVDDEEVPILEVRKLEFAIQEEAAAGPSES